MAAGRPRVFKWRDAKLSAVGLTEENADLLRGILDNSEPKLKPFEEPQLEETMKEEAFTIHRMNHKFYIITFKFNTEHKHCMISNIEEVGDSMAVADMRFKVLIAQKVLAKLKNV